MTAAARYRFTVDIEVPAGGASADAIREDLADLLTDAAGGYVGDPDRSLGGTKVRVGTAGQVTS